MFEFIKTSNSIFILIIPIFLFCQNNINEIELILYNDTIRVCQDTNLINNFFNNEHAINDSIHAKGGKLIVQMKNNSDSRLVFTNIMDLFICSSSSIGESNNLNTSLNKSFFENNAELAYSVLDDGHNMSFAGIIGDACCMSRSSMQYQTDQCSNNGYLFLPYKYLREHHFDTQKYQSILLLEPRSSFEWEIVYKDCMLYLFNGLEEGKYYDLIITYFQGKDREVPDLGIDDYKMFSGYIKSNSIPIIYNRLGLDTR